MALTWTWDEGVERDDLGWVENPRGGFTVAPVTQAVIFATMAVGINHITAATVDKFAERVAAWESAHGTMLTSTDGPRPLTRDDVYDHIGLHTNASRFTDREFTKKLRSAAA